MLLNYISVGALIALQGFDVWSTLKILKRGGKEHNKFLKRLMDAIGVSQTLLLTKIPVCILVLALTIFIPTFPSWIIWTIVFIIQGILLTKYNFKTLRK